MSRKQPAPRVSSLDGKTIYLVDSRFDDSVELLKQVQAWFAAKMPGVKTQLRSMGSYYGKDDPKLWNEIKTQGHAAIIGVGHCSTCAPAVSTHAITLETQYGVPTVALHTDKFVRVVQSVTRMGGLPQAPLVFVPQPVMGKSEAELRAYVEGNDPYHRQAGDAGDHRRPDARPGRQCARRGAVRARTPRLEEPDTEDNLHAAVRAQPLDRHLPIVLPTEERVAAMLAGTSRRPTKSSAACSRRRTAACGNTRWRKSP